MTVEEDLGTVRVVGNGVDSSCLTPCTLQVPPGTYKVTTKMTSETMLLDRPSRIFASRGSPALANASTVMLVAGAAIALASVIVPLVACRSSDRSVDACGRVLPASNACDGISDGAKVAWIAGGGVGLTLALVGGVSLALTGPSLRARDWRGASATLSVRF